MKLNIGCGSSPKSGDWLNLDAYRESAHHRHRTAPDALADAHALPIRANAVAHVRLRHVLEHLDRPLAALRECVRVLEPGGTAYVEVPNPTSRREGGVGPERKAHHRMHIYGWSAGSLERICERAGFDGTEYRPDHPDSQPRGHAVVAVVEG